MRRRLLPALLAPLALMTACGYRVHYDYDITQAPGFARYKTFDWYATSKRGNKGKDEGFMDKRVEAMVEKELQLKGFQQEKSADPDFLITWYPVYRNRRVRTTTRVGVGYGGWRRPWGYGVGTSFSQVNTYREGSVVIEIVDFRSNQLVWQGGASDVLTGFDNPEDANEAVGRAVHQILANFPPQPR